MIARDFFGRSDSHAVALGLACHRLMGPEWLEYEPRTVYEGIRDRGFVDITEENANKINAFRVAKNTILPWMDHESFEKTVLGLIGLTPNFQLREPLNVAQCMVGIDMLNAIQQVPFAIDLKRYIAACAKNDEVDFLPDPLTFCMPYLCPPMYKCMDCGSVDEDDLEDGKCDTCVARYEDGTANGEPEPGREGFGLNIQRFMPYDYAPISTAFGRLSRISIDLVNLGESYVDIQVGKLLSYNEYRNEFKHHMELQIREVMR
jgi:hypothetical protein